MKTSVYSRPNKPRFMDVKNRRNKGLEIAPIELTQPIMVHASTECHRTPNDEAARMVDYLNWEPGQQILEPHGGTGQLVRALLDSGVSSGQIDVVELNNELYSRLDAEFSPAGTKVNQGCFLEYATAYSGDGFNKIILNPPFKAVRKHMAAALKLLKRGGSLIALVPVTYRHDDLYEIEILSNDTFSTAKVNTKIIEIER
jgi:phospholipid N-methyltransferase